RTRNDRPIRKRCPSAADQAVCSHAVFRRVRQRQWVFIACGDREGPGCAQFSQSAGDPPYLMAVSARPASSDDMIFLIANAPSELPQCCGLSEGEVRRVAVTFVTRGVRDLGFVWEEICPTIGPARGALCYASPPMTGAPPDGMSRSAAHVRPGTRKRA